MDKLRAWQLAAVIAVLFFALWGLCSCVDIIRGNQSITNIYKTTESAIAFYADTDATVQADKNMSDSLKHELAQPEAGQ